MYEGVLHKQQNEFDTWFSMQLRSESDPLEFMLLVELAELFGLNRSDFFFLNIHLPLPESLLVNPCRAGNKNS